MQIFKTNSDYNKAMQDLDDNRLRKTIIEDYDLLNILAMDRCIGLKSHYNHPITTEYRNLNNKYVAAEDIYKHFMACLDECRYRFGQEWVWNHKYYIKFVDDLEMRLKIDDEFPDVKESIAIYHKDYIVHKGSIVYEKYRDLLADKWITGIRSGNKLKTPRWTKRKPPKWFRSVGNIIELENNVYKIELSEV